VDQAAQVGDITAQNNLGRVLATMLDPPELAEARTWYTSRRGREHHRAEQSPAGCLPIG